MPVIVHFMRRVQRTPGNRSEGTTLIPTCGANLASVYGAQRTRDKSRVTCKRCRKKLGLLDPEIVMDESATGARPTAWDHLDALDDEGGPTPEPEPVPLPDPPPPARPLPVPAAPWVGVRREELRDRIAIVFFHLMRSHLGIDTVVNIAGMASRHVTGPGIDLDLEQRSRALADLILTPASEHPIPE